MELPDNQIKCARCQRTFECRADDVANCQCSQVTLAPPIHLFLRKTHYDCLCQTCLREINQMVVQAQDQGPFSPKTPLKEGLHYYKENGMWVFTEYYHLWKGYCCRNGCRHCAYGYEKR